MYMYSRNMLNIAVIILVMSLMYGTLSRLAHSNPLITRGARALLATLSKSKHTLSVKKIRSLSTLATKPNGTRLVGKLLGKMRLPTEILEDSYLRIAIAQGKLSRKKAQDWFRALRGTPGFRSTLSKVIGRSAAKTKGHLNEISLAAQSRMRGLKVIAIGQSFVDPRKRAPTDLDLILEVNRRRFVIETKDYAPTTRLPMDQIRADLDTLKSYTQRTRGSIPVFSATNKPADHRDLLRLKSETRKRGIQLTFGDAESQAEQLKVLGSIL